MIIVKILALSVATLCFLLALSENYPEDYDKIKMAHFYCKTDILTVVGVIASAVLMIAIATTQPV